MSARKWTPQEFRLLGKLSDAEFARRFGRRTKAEEKLLGSDTDEKVARLLKRDRATVGDRRRQLGIPATIRDWTPAEDQLLGTMPDRKLAAHLGRTLFSVQNRRLKLGVPVAPNPQYRPWSAREIRLLGTKPDSDVAKLSVAGMKPSATNATFLTSHIRIRATTGGHRRN
jgi:hypothetical protein